MRIPYHLGLVLILALLVGIVISDSMSPFLSMVLDGSIAILIIGVVALMRPRKTNG